VSFAAPLFLWYFLPATLVAIWLLPHRCRNGVIAVASVLFYAVGGKQLVLLLIGLMALNYVAGLAIGWVKAPPPLGCSSGQGRQGDLGTLSLIAPVGSAPASRSRAA
jgi:hypothetical protein